MIKLFTSFRIIFLFCIFFFLSCHKKNEPNPSQNPPNQNPIIDFPEKPSFNNLKTRIIDGTIVLPQSSNLNQEDIKIVTLLDSSEVKKNKFRIVGIAEEHQALIALNKNHEPILLAYVPLGQNQIEISTTTTAIALVLMAPWATDLSTVAKMEAITRVQSTPGFDNLVNLLDSKLRTGENLFSGDVQALVSQVSLVKKRGFRKSGATLDPKLMQVFPDELVFENRGIGASYTIGVYNEDDILRKRFLLQGMTLVYGSIGDFLSGRVANVDSPSKETVKLASNGTYKIIIRNMNANDISKETLNTIYEDLYRIIGKHLIKAWTGEALAKIISDECIRGTLDNIFIEPLTKLLQQTRPKDATEWWSFMIEFLIGTLESREKLAGIIVKCLKDSDSEMGKKAFEKNATNYLTRILSLFNLLSKGVEISNAGFIIGDAFKYNNAIDTCLVKDGAQIIDCNDKIVGTYYLQSSRGTSIGEIWGIEPGIPGILLTKGELIIKPGKVPELPNRKVYDFYFYIEGKNQALQNPSPSKFIDGNGFLTFSRILENNLNVPNGYSWCDGPPKLVSGIGYCSQLPPGRLYTATTYDFRYSFEALVLLEDGNTIVSAHAGQSIWIRKR